MEQPPGRKPPEPPRTPDLRPIVLGPQVTRPLVGALQNLFGENLEEINKALEEKEGRKNLNSLAPDNANYTTAVTGMTGSFNDAKRLFDDLEKAGELKIIPKVGGGDYVILSESHDRPTPNSSTVLTEEERTKFLKFFNDHFTNSIEGLLLARLINDGVYGDIPDAKERVQIVAGELEEIKKKHTSLNRKDPLEMKTDHEGNTKFTFVLE